MIIENSISGPDASLSLDRLYRGETRAIYEIYVAGTALPMGCAVTWTQTETLASGQLPLKCSLATKQSGMTKGTTVFSASTKLLCGLYTGRVANASKGTYNTGFLFTLTTTIVPGWHAASGDVVYVVVKGWAIGYVEGTTDVAVGDEVSVASSETITADGQLAVVHAAATTDPGYFWASLTSGGAVTSAFRGPCAPRFVCGTVTALAGTAHSSNKSVGANGSLVLVNF